MQINKSCREVCRIQTQTQNSLKLNIKLVESYRFKNFIRGWIKLLKYLLLAVTTMNTLQIIENEITIFNAKNNML